MTSYLEQSKELQVVLKTAFETGMIAETLEALAKLAVIMAQFGKTSEAAEAVSYVMQHPDVPYDIYDRAEDVFLDLETHLCPRVLSDAKVTATYRTLRSAVEAALSVTVD
ncbi:MAG: hypothetical protein MUF87_07265 [Anaerolineae bacterium]|nr:hypothetical protein [Anaerolineae bacterium]